nr:hypothetical protein [uncultured bacterium]
MCGGVNGRHSRSYGCIAYSSRMARIEILHKAAVTAIDYRCTSGPDEAAFPEVHVRHSLSYVRKGTFGCTCRGRVLDLVPGSLFIGHPGDEYICSHSHHRGGDECLSFQFDADVVAEIAPDAQWRAGMVPPLPELVILGSVGRWRPNAAAAWRSMKSVCCSVHDSHA